MKSEYIERRYKLNRSTTVVVKSRKDKNAEIYKNSIQVITESMDLEPLKIGTREEIEKAIKEIELEDDQASLFAGEKG